LHFFRLDIIIILVVPFILVIGIGTRGVVTWALVAASALLVVAVHVLEVEAASGNYCDFL